MQHTMYVALPKPLRLLSTHTSHLLATALQFLEFLTIFSLHSFILVVKLHELRTVHIFFVGLQTILLPC